MRFVIVLVVVVVFVMVRCQCQNLVVLCSFRAELHVVGSYAMHPAVCNPALDMLRPAADSDYNIPAVADTADKPEVIVHSQPVAMDVVGLEPHRTSNLAAAAAAADTRIVLVVCYTAYTSVVVLLCNLLGCSGCNLYQWRGSHLHMGQQGMVGSTAAEVGWQRCQEAGSTAGLHHA